MITLRPNQVEPIRKAVEFFDEGEAMHHCVFTNGYYMKKDTLIFSAKDDNGNRLATVEYNIPEKTIMQCRAAYNKVPENKSEIETLILNKLLFLR